MMYMYMYGMEHFHFAVALNYVCNYMYSVCVELIWIYPYSKLLANTKLYVHEIHVPSMLAKGTCTTCTSWQNEDGNIFYGP